MKKGFDNASAVTALKYPNTRWLLRKPTLYLLTYHRVTLLNAWLEANNGKRNIKLTVKQGCSKAGDDKQPSNEKQGPSDQAADGGLGDASIGHVDVGGTKPTTRCVVADGQVAQPLAPVWPLRQLLNQFFRMVSTFLTKILKMRTRSGC